MRREIKIEPHLYAVQGARLTTYFTRLNGKRENLGNDLARAKAKLAALLEFPSTETTIRAMCDGYLAEQRQMRVDGDDTALAERTGREQRGERGEVIGAQVIGEQLVQHDDARELRVVSGVLEQRGRDAGPSEVEGDERVEAEGGGAHQDVAHAVLTEHAHHVRGEFGRLHHATRRGTRRSDFSASASPSLPAS